MSNPGQGQRIISEITETIMQVLSENCIVTNRKETDISSNDKWKGLHLLLRGVLS